MADQLGIGRHFVQPDPPDSVEGIPAYLEELRTSLDKAYDDLSKRLNEFLVERQESLTTLSQFTGNQNNLDCGDGIMFRISTDASRDITGLAAGIDGQVKRFVNVGSSDAVFKNQDANSDAVNRLLNDTGADVTVSANESIEYWYDLTTARWRGFSQTWT